MNLDSSKLFPPTTIDPERIPLNCQEMPKRKKLSFKILHYCSFMPPISMSNKHFFGRLLTFLFIFMGFIFIFNGTFWPFKMGGNEHQGYYNEISALHSKNYEIRRRNLDNSIQEFYYYLSDQARKNANNTAFKSFTDRALDEYISLMAQTSNFGPVVDDTSEWHKSELQKLTDMIQERIHKLQHPESCTEARILVCVLSVVDCGLCCLLHRVGHCLRFASVTNRTVVIKNDNEWKYTKQGWSAVYEPISSCTYGNIFKENEKEVKWKSLNQADRIVNLNYEFANIVRPVQKPLSFPKQIADSLFKHHSNPAIWFGSQFYWYPIRINQQMRAMVKMFARRIKFNEGPIVGIQIRRTDKLNQEAQFIPLDKYFEWTELWYRVQERRNPTALKMKRRVYIATDDLSIIKKAKKRYPHYEIHTNPRATQNAQVNTRYSDESLHGVIVDYEILSKCDYVVCTMSSNICRLVHEIIQIERGDAENLVHSLDDTYYNYYQEHNYVAIQDHHASSPSELSFKVGDLVGIHEGKGNLWDGQSRGFIGNISNKGTYPTYKVRESWRIVDFPYFEP